jgi:beta-glucanase (GH16 family)
MPEFTKPCIKRRIAIVSFFLLGATCLDGLAEVIPGGSQRTPSGLMAPGPGSRTEVWTPGGAVDAVELAVTFAAPLFSVDEGETRPIIVRLTRRMDENDPPQVSVDYTVEPAIAEAGRDFVQTAPQTLTFTNGGAPFVLVPLETLEDDKYEGTERLFLRLSNPVDVAAGRFVQSAVRIVDDDPYDPQLLDDFEDHPYLWSGDEQALLDNAEIAADEPLALPGQGAFEGVLEIGLPRLVDVDVRGRPCGKGNGVIPVVLWTTDTFDATTVDHTTVTLGDAQEAHRDPDSGTARRHEEDVDRDGDMDLVFHFRSGACSSDVATFGGRTYDGQWVTSGRTELGLRRDLALGQDWSLFDGLKLWFYGTGTGSSITVELLDNRAPDPGPGGWELVWSDEFDTPAGTPPDAAHWRHEIGDGTVNGIPGWGNAELQYYTDSTDNAATDGLGNLVINAREADGSLQCYYGSCRYTSARLISRSREEFAYGRIESRILLPDGDRGLWPAFWSLGTDIGRVGWPQSGEIDIMEYVSREPYEVFGTIHGPGYAGGASFGDTYVTYPERIARDYHTFAVEWQPDLIEWYVDGVLYHTAIPIDVPGEWVFNDPFFLIFNMAVGGYFGGPVSPLTTFPQSMAIDYVRVYQAPDTAERWEASFVDDFVGWREVEVPFNAFVRSARQPAGAPDDGLDLTEVWGYGFRLPDGVLTTGRVLLDQVRLTAPGSD